MSDDYTPTVHTDDAQQRGDTQADNDRRRQLEGLLPAHSYNIVTSFPMKMSSVKGQGDLTTTVGPGVVRYMKRIPLARANTKAKTLALSISLSLFLSSIKRMSDLDPLCHVYMNL